MTNMEPRAVGKLQPRFRSSGRTREWEGTPFSDERGMAWLGMQAKGKGAALEPFHESPAPSEDTDAYRLFSGKRFQVERWGEHWLVQTAEGGFPEEVPLDGAASVWWKRLDVHRKTEPPVRRAGVAPPGSWVVSEHGVRFEVSFEAGYSQGLFLDQRLNRQTVRERMEAGQRLLNTFAYTGAFSVVGALAGATATTLDLSQTYLDWARRNFALNGMDASGHHFTKGDVQEWLRRWRKSGLRFDGVILDPPTFSRNASGKVFRVEKDYGALVEAAAWVLEPGGWVLCCTNCRRLPVRAFDTQVREGMAAAGVRRAKFVRAPMPPEYGGDDYLQTIWVET